MPWADRLVEVWAEPGEAGAGIILDERVVLTAHHIVAPASASADGSGAVLARVVIPHQHCGHWVAMRVAWGSAEWDVAVLVPAEPAARTEVAAIGFSSDWRVPETPRPDIVRLSDLSARLCESVGFPQAEVQRPSELTADADLIRQTDQVIGDLLPAGQGKRPAHPTRPLPKQWFPFDVRTSLPDTPRGWGGFSGAALADAGDGRLVGLVVAAESRRQLRRLYVVPLAPVLDDKPDLGHLLADLGTPLTVEAGAAREYRRLMDPISLGPEGAPLRVSEAELGAFGVKPASVPHEPPYLEYVPRDDDERLHAALVQAMDERKLLLVVGGSAAGKSRSAAEAVCVRLPNHRLIRPRGPLLSEVAAALPAVGGPCLIWLDDAQGFATTPQLKETLRELLNAGHAVVGTMRLAELERLTPRGDVRNPAGDALADDALVRRVDWKVAWSDAEQARLREHVSSASVLAGATGGRGLGPWLVAGPLLVATLEGARRDEEHPFRASLVDCTLAWVGTGIGVPIPRVRAFDLVDRLAGTNTRPDSAERRDALLWATTPEIGTNRTAQALLTLEEETDLLLPHDYVLDHAQREQDGIVIPDEVWTAALHAITAPEQLASVGISALHAGRLAIAQRCMLPLATAGDSRAMFNLALMLEESAPLDALHWYEQAAINGETSAMFNLGVHFNDSEPKKARRWYEQAAAAGSTDAMNNLGALLSQSKPKAARRWYERAAAAGADEAKHNLGVLLVESEPVTARRWWEEAAAAGHVDAMFSLGKLLEGSELATARRWYEQAAAGGHVGAMFNLGTCSPSPNRRPHVAGGSRPRWRVIRSQCSTWECCWSSRSQPRHDVGGRRAPPQATSTRCSTWALWSGNRSRRLHAAGGRRPPAQATSTRCSI